MTITHDMEPHSSDMISKAELLAYLEKRCVIHKRIELNAKIRTEKRVNRAIAVELLRMYSEIGGNKTEIENKLKELYKTTIK